MRYVQGIQPNVPACSTCRHGLYNYGMCTYLGTFQAKIVQKKPPLFNFDLEHTQRYVHVPKQTKYGTCMYLGLFQRYVHVPQSYIQANPSCTYQCTSQLCMTSDLFSTAPVIAANKTKIKFKNFLFRSRTFGLRFTRLYCLPNLS